MDLRPAGRRWPPRPGIPAALRRPRRRGRCRRSAIVGPRARGRRRRGDRLRGRAPRRGRAAAAWTAAGTPGACVAACSPGGRRAGTDDRGLRRHRIARSLAAMTRPDAARDPAGHAHRQGPAGRDLRRSSHAVAGRRRGARHRADRAPPPAGPRRAGHGAPRLEEAARAARRGDRPRRSTCVEVERGEGDNKARREGRSHVTVHRRAAARPARWPRSPAGSPTPAPTSTGSSGWPATRSPRSTCTCPAPTPSGCARCWPSRPPPRASTSPSSPPTCCAAGCG